VATFARPLRDLGLGNHDIHALASADTEAVYGVWTGLGYYSRARNLQAAARTVVDEYQGELPSEVEGLQRLKGIGRYTAGALASIAFDRPAPLVDGNVVRVLARLFGVRENVANKSVMDDFWSLAEDLVRGERPGDFNQALMELGATVCTPRTPGCTTCPLRRQCDAHATGDAEALPIKTKKTRVKTVQAVAAWLPRNGKVLAVRRPEGGLLGGLWELPGGDLDNVGKVGEEERCAPGDLEAALRRSLAEGLNLDFTRAEYAGEIAHAFTHRRLRLHVFRCSGPSGRVRRADSAEHRWLEPGAIAALPHGGPTRKALALLGEGNATPHRVRARRESTHPANSPELK